MLPAHRRSFAPEWQKKADEADRRRVRAEEKMEDRYNQTAKALPPLEIGARVAVQDTQPRLWDRYGVVVQLGWHCKYFVRLQSGRILVRNRRFLRRRYVLAEPMARQKETTAESTADTENQEDSGESPGGKSERQSPSVRRPPEGMATPERPLCKPGRWRKKPDRLIEHDDI